MSIRADLERVPNSAWSNHLVSLRPLQTQDDLIYALFDCQLTEAQKGLVNPASFSIGRAYLFREDNYPCIICNEMKVPIGFMNLDKWLSEGDAYSWSFMIDKRHQGKGYGRSAAELAISVFNAANPAKPIRLSTEQNNEKAQRLYRSLGFRLLPVMDGDDLVFEWDPVVWPNKPKRMPGQQFLTVYPSATADNE